jgi:hypothetical protein
MSKQKKAPAKAPKEALPKTAPEPKPKKERAPKADLVVFAFRLPAADRDLIHKAAGPGKATRFVLAAALAASNADDGAFKELSAQAKANLK